MRHEEKVKGRSSKSGGLFPSEQGAGPDLGPGLALPRWPTPLEAGLTAWAASRTIFRWPWWSCTFRRRQFRNRSTAQLNSLQSSEAV